MSVDYEAAEKAASTLLAVAASLGMTANVGKCELMPVDSNAPALDPARYPTIAGFQRKAALKILGAHIARDDDTERAALQQRESGRHARFFGRLTRMPGPEGMAVLRLCGVPKGTYAVRTHAPEVTLAMARQFDALVVLILPDESRYLTCRRQDHEHQQGHEPPESHNSK